MSWLEIQKLRNWRLSTHRSTTYNWVISQGLPNFIHFLWNNLIYNAYKFYSLRPYFLSHRSSSSQCWRFITSWFNTFRSLHTNNVIWKYDPAIFNSEFLPIANLMVRRIIIKKYLNYQWILFYYPTWRKITIFYKKKKPLNLFSISCSVNFIEWKTAFISLFFFKAR